MSEVEKIHDELARNLLLEYLQEGVISDHTANQYQDMVAHFSKEMVNISLEKFAALTANRNPGKSGIGEKAQLIYLKRNKFPNLQKLPAKGEDCLSLTRNNDGTLAIVQGLLSNIDGVRTFDAIENSKLFVLKAVDLGSTSTSKGGGHQTNVRSEIMRLISTVGSNSVLYKSKPVEILIVVDGRSAEQIISYCRPHITGKISISTSEAL